MTNSNSQAGLSKVHNTYDKQGRVSGHYQWATHKNGSKDSLSVVKVVKDHEGNEQVLYKTYKESAIAKEVREAAIGKKEIKDYLGDVKLGEKYKDKEGNISAEGYKITDLLGFQLTGFIIVMFVLTTLWWAIGGVSSLLKLLGLDKEAPKAAAPVATSAATAKTIHPGMSDEQFVAILTAAAVHAVGGNRAAVVKFRPLNTMDWTWAVQGKVALHTNKV